LSLDIPFVCRARYASVDALLRNTAAFFFQLNLVKAVNFHAIFIVDAGWRYLESLR